MMLNPIQNEANKCSELKEVFITKSLNIKIPKPKKIKQIYNQLAITKEYVFNNNK